jgi:hypothetical protein
MEAVNCTCGVPVDIGTCKQPIPQGVACILYDDKVLNYIGLYFFHVVTRELLIPKYNIYYFIILDYELNYTTYVQRI